MKKTTDNSSMRPPLFQRLKNGLEEGIQFAKGVQKLRTIENEVTILARVLGNGEKPLPLDWARHLLALGFTDQEEARMNELADRNRQGTLSDSEKDELLGYAKAGCLLGILHSKARLALKSKIRPKHTTP